MLRNRNNFTLYRAKAPDAFLTRARGRAGVSPFRAYIRAGKLEAGSWRQAGNKLEGSWEHVDYRSWNHGLWAAEYGVRTDVIELRDYGDWSAHRLGM